MRRATFLVLLILLSMPAFAQVSLIKKWEETDSTKRVALVIGNSDYQYGSNLKNPVNDADAMAKTLKDLGFEVILVKNANRKEMIAAIKNFGNKLTMDSVALVYYSGHNIQLGGQDYLLPIDFAAKTATATGEEGVSIGRIFTEFTERKSPANVLILDCCRNNPFWKTGSNGGGLEKLSAPRGTFIAYATAPGSVAGDSSDSGNGLYTTELLKQIIVPNVKIEDMFRVVREAVAERSNEKQIPWEESSLRGDLYLVKGGTSGEKTITDAGERVNLKARMKVTTTPENAVVKVDGVAVDKGTFALTLLDAEAKTVKLTVTAEGYEPDVRNVKLERGRPQNSRSGVGKVSRSYPHYGDCRDKRRL